MDYHSIPSRLFLEVDDAVWALKTVIMFGTFEIRPVPHRFAVVLGHSLLT